MSTMSAVLRRLGNTRVQEYARAQNISLHEARNVDAWEIREEWKYLIEKGIVSKTLLIREFMYGWRGSIMRHGTRYAYRKGCRCEPCKEASRKYLKDLHKSRQQKATQTLAQFLDDPPNKDEMLLATIPMESKRMMDARLTAFARNTKLSFDVVKAWGHEAGLNVEGTRSWSEAMVLRGCLRKNSAGYFTPKGNPSPDKTVVPEEKEVVMTVDIEEEEGEVLA